MGKKLVWTNEKINLLEIAASEAVELKTLRGHKRQTLNWAKAFERRPSILKDLGGSVEYVRKAFSKYRKSFDGICIYPKCHKGPKGSNYCCEEHSKLIVKKNKAFRSVHGRNWKYDPRKR